MTKGICTLYFLLLCVKMTSQNNWNYTLEKTIKDANQEPILTLYRGEWSSGYDGYVKWKIVNNSKLKMYDLILSDQKYIMTDGEEITRLGGSFSPEILYPGESAFLSKTAVNSDKVGGFSRVANPATISDVEFIRAPCVVKWRWQPGGEYNCISQENRNSSYEQNNNNGNSRYSGNATETIQFSMVGAEMVSETSDANGLAQELTISKIGNRGGYLIESRDPDRRENGTLYMRKSFTFNHSFRSFQLDIGRGKITSYDRTSNQMQTSQNLREKWGDKFSSEEYEKVSNLSFNCNIYLGELTGSIENIWALRDPVLSFGAKNAEKNQNPRTIYSPSNTPINLNGNTAITCVCKFYEARKDDYHEIEIPYTSLILKK